MYIIERVKVPEGYRFSEYCLYLATEIKELRNREENLDILFRLTYPKAKDDLMRFTNLLPLEELETFLSIAFMKAVRGFDPSAKNASFMGYYHSAMYSEIILGYYGKYRKTPELRNLKKRVDGTMASLETPVLDKNGQDTGYYHDLIEDPYSGVDNEIKNRDYVEEVKKAIDRTFYVDNEWKRNRVSRAKEMFTKYVMAALKDNPVTMTSIAYEYGVTRSAVSNIVVKYREKFKEELSKIEK